MHTIIADYIKERQRSGERVRASALFELFDENTPELPEILDLSLGERLDGPGAEKYFGDCVRILEQERIDEEIRRLSAACDAETDMQRKKRLTRQIAELTIQRKNL